MSAPAIQPQGMPERPASAEELTIPRVHYLNAGYGWKSWLFTLDHKRIAILYLISVTFMFFIGGFGAMIVRLNLLSPEGALVRPQTYNRMFSMHGIVMVFFFLVPVIPAVLGNFVVPMMIGAKDLAFPKVNLISWYVYMLGALIGTGAMILGGVDTGWTFYTPLSTQYAYGNVALTIVGAFLAGFSSILTGLNFIITIHKMRAPGMTWWHMPIMLWTMYAVSILQVLATPVLAITLLALLVERVAGIGIFDPHLGGDPILMQHMFWFYSHPAVYIMILPGMGVVSEIIPCFARRPLFGYRFVALASIALGIISFFLWAHHMFVTSISPFAAMCFSFLTFWVAIPSAIKVFNWTATLYKGSIRYDTPMLYALGFVGLFTVGGLSGLYLAGLGMDLHLHDTYFVIAHFHFIMVGAQVSAFLAGLHFWWPKMTGRRYPETWGRLAASILFIGFNLTFLPQFLLGYAGMPRRYATYAPEFQVLNVMSTAGASILAVGYALPFFYLLWSLKKGPIAGPNPWRATGLEWQTPSPPPTFNFDRTPIVTQLPYRYNPEADELFDAQGEIDRARLEYERVRANVETTHQAHAEEEPHGD